MHKNITDTLTPINEKNKPSKKFITEAELKTEVKRIKQKALQVLQKGNSTAALEYLKLLQKGNITQVDQDIPEIDTFIANLALEHENPKILEALLKSIRPENHLLIISGHNDDYNALRQFIERSLHQSCNDYKAIAETKRNILTLLIEIDPQLEKIISDQLNQPESDTLTAFKKDFKTVCNKESYQNSLLFLTCNKEKNLELHITDFSHSSSTIKPSH